MEPERRSREQSSSRGRLWRWAHGLLAVVGFVLSPLSWWNDLFVNVPLAYLFSLPFALIDEALYLPSFILGYWLSNILGLVLLHNGIGGVLRGRRVAFRLRAHLLWSLLYTVLIAAVVWLGWLPSPERYLPAH
ncbi:MAG: hypothetical protein P8009_04080 [Gammaproteobacteria bacterium]